ncbi:FAD-dependent oxidoreductase [Devosia sp.]|uniref:FAD-dependent oxidoreductase n=1 Tax=Devosia sp. TaxID=1871048 RepID=UPI003BA972B4
MSPYRLAADAAHGFGGAELDRSKPLRFRLNGRVVTGFSGDTVLSASLASGIQIAGRQGDIPLALSESFAPQIVLAGGPARDRRELPMERTPALDGVDYVTRGERRDVLASNGLGGLVRNLVVGPGRTLNHRFGSGGSPSPAWLSAPPELQLTADIVVVGAGIAGLSAVAAALELGKRVILIERSQCVGGAIRFFGTVDNEENPNTLLTRLNAQLASHPRLTQLLSTEAFRVEANRVLAHQVSVENGVPVGRVVAITADRIILATGARERLPIFPGNRSPGVVGALAAFQRAERFGVWAGQRALFATPHSATYRLALYAQDAGIAVQRIADTRLNPATRYVDFCKATGLTLASGLVVAEALTLKRNLPGLRVSFAVAIDEITQDATPIETDQLIAAGSWQPDIALWLSAGGSAAWDADNHWLAPRGTLASIALAGSAAGYRSTTACLASGRTTVDADKSSAPILDPVIDVLFESPDAPTPVAPYRPSTQGAAYLDGGWTLITRRSTAASRHGVAHLAVRPVALSLGDVAGATATGLVLARDTGTVAVERCITGGDVADIGWQVPSAAPAETPPRPPLYLTGRFGPKPVSCILAAEPARAFEPGCMVFESSDATDPLKAIGVIYAAGGFALLSKTPQPEAPLYVRDSNRAVAVKLQERLKL